MTTILINAAAGPLLDVAAKVLTRPDLPDAALIGGLAGTIRVAAHTASYRATADVIRSTFLTRPGKAAALMTPIDTPLIDADDVASLMDRFVRTLDSM